MNNVEVILGLYGSLVIAHLLLDRYKIRLGDEVSTPFVKL